MTIQVESSAKAVVLDPREFEKERGPFVPFSPLKGEKGAITYTLSSPGIVRVFVRPKNLRFAALRTLVDWEAREAGQYTDTWDGLDERGNVLETAACAWTIEVQPKRGSISEHDFKPAAVDYPYGDGHPHNFYEMHGENVWIHALHAPELCRQLKVNVALPASGAKVSGICRVGVRVSEEGRGYGRIVGHSARYYVDYMLLHEDKTLKGPEGFWDWDTTGLPKGKHIFTVACCDHHDHMGTDSVVVELV